MVLYSGTTVCLDALAGGLPVIDVEFDDFLSPDPLFDFSDFKWTAANREELLDAVEEISALSDDEYYKRQEKGLEYVQQYFLPVNEENLAEFIDSRNSGTPGQGNN